MRITCGSRQSLDRQFIVLAPDHRASMQFTQSLEDPSRHRRLLEAAQRLRGKVYVEDGAVESRQLSADGRHIQAADARSWHLLAVDRRERVVACIRYLAHTPKVSFFDLSVSHSALARSSAFGPRMRAAVEAEIDNASARGVAYVEIGGWAICEELRCTSEAFQMLLSVYALGQLSGGAVGLSTATTRHRASSILKRVGGRPLVAAGAVIPPYYDPEYDCEMELLGFDSNSAGARYANGIHHWRTALLDVPIISPGPSSSLTESLSQGLLPLHTALVNTHVGS